MQGQRVGCVPSTASTATAVDRQPRFASVPLVEEVAFSAVPEE